MISWWGGEGRTGERGKEGGAGGEEMLEMLRELERKELLVVETNCATFSLGGDVTVPLATDGVRIELNAGKLTEAELGGGGREKGALFLTTIACCDSPGSLCMRTCWGGREGAGSLSLVWGLTALTAMG